jgi:hypothetical protein
MWVFFLAGSSQPACVARLAASASASALRNQGIQSDLLFLQNSSVKGNIQRTR